MDDAVAHRLDEFLALRVTGLLQIAVDRPEHFAIPLESSLRGIVGRVARDLNRLAQVLPLHLLDLCLHVGVTDVDMGVGKEVQFPIAYRAERELLLHEGLSVPIDTHRQLVAVLRRGNAQQAGLATERQGEFNGGPIAHMQQHLDRLGVRIIERDGQGACGACGGLLQRLPGLDVELKPSGARLPFAGHEEADITAAGARVARGIESGDLPTHVARRGRGGKGRHRAPARLIDVIDCHRGEHFGEIRLIGEDQRGFVHRRHILAIDMVKASQADRFPEVEIDECLRPPAVRGVLGQDPVVQNVLDPKIARRIPFGAADDPGRGGRDQGREAGRGTLAGGRENWREPKKTEPQQGAK